VNAEVGTPQEFNHERTSALRVVPSPDSIAFERFLAEFVAAVEFQRTPDGFVPEWESLSDLSLLAWGLPVAVQVGDELADHPDETADCHEAAVISIETARLRRFPREMHPLRRKVVGLTWGIGTERPQSQREIARRTGLAQASVRRTLDAAMAELRSRFGVEEPDAA